MITSIKNGFSMVEMLMAAFILAVGLLGLSLLQVLSLRGDNASRVQHVAIGIGQNILESIDSEARQARLFRVMDPASAAPVLSSYFGGTQVVNSYNFYGTPVNAASADPLERVQVLYATVDCVKETTGASAASGGIYDFIVAVHFYDSKTSTGTLTERVQTFRRKVVV